MAREVVLCVLLLLACQCAADACPAKPCQPWREDNVGGGGQSCSQGAAWDLRFAYGSFDCNAPSGDYCCGTNTYGTDKQEECSPSAPVPGPGPGPGPGPTPPPTPPAGQCVKPKCGGSQSQECVCYMTDGTTSLFYYVNPTVTTTEPAGYFLGLQSAITLAETATPTITLDGGDVLQEVSVTGGICGATSSCQSLPHPSCPTTVWVKTTSVEVCTPVPVRTAMVQNTGSQCYTSGNQAPQCVGYRTHSFCPKVDQFQQFRLAGSARILNASSRREPIELLAWGSGKGYDRADKQPYAVRFPTADMYSRMPIYVANHSDCGGGAAIATVLLYNVTIRSGKFGYKNAQPIGNGFTPTCDGPGMKCKFDSKKVCIGKSVETDPGQTHYNCGQCVASWGGQLDELDIQIFVSYYGTDPSGRTMTSGSSNPINFRQFADADVYDDVWNSARNFKPPSLPF